VADDEADRPLLTEMAEKLRQARGSSFTDRPESTPPRESAAPRPAPPPRPESRPSPPDADRFPPSARIDSLERRLFELRIALDEAVAGRAGAPADADVAAWIAFAAAAMSQYDDATAQAEAADQLLAEYRARRARGGVLSDEG
jgi:hypothetical protein